MTTRKTDTSPMSASARRLPAVSTVASVAWLPQALGLESLATSFTWQRDLPERFQRGDIPRALDLPTGLGKTSVIALWCGSSGAVVDGSSSDHIDALPRGRDRATMAGHDEYAITSPSESPPSPRGDNTAMNTGLTHEEKNRCR